MSIAASENASLGTCELQLGDTWGGMQGKMSVAAPVMKIRKKSENKPQAQINKCNNEKRRRELENETINQLEELLGACLSDVKQPDKNGIVHEASVQIREVLRRRRDDVTACCRDCPPLCSQHCRPTQAGDVTTSQNNILAQNSELTVLIQALKHYTSSLGWVLLEINSEGNIECVTENIKDIANWDRSDLYKESIYNYLHVGDHHKFAPILNVQTVGWNAFESDKLRAVRTRLLVKGNEGVDTPSYIEVSIHAAPVRGGSGAGEESGSVMCVIRRCDDNSGAAVSLPTTLPPKQLAQITFKLSLDGHIRSCDLSGAGVGAPAPRSLEGATLASLVEPAWQARVVAHVRTAPAPPADTSETGPFRIRLAPDQPWLTVRAHSRLFRANPTSNDSDFVMSTYTILGQDEEPPTSPGEPSFSFDSEFEFPSLSSWVPYERNSNKSSFGSCSYGGDSSGGEEQPQHPRRSPETTKLYTLLSKKQDSPDGGNTDNCRILKDLLKQKDDESGAGTPLTPNTPMTPMAPLTPHTPHEPSSPLHTQSAAGKPDVLLRSLIGKSDEDGEDSRRSELRQLLQNGGSDSDLYRKRKSDEGTNQGGQPPKRPNIEVSSSGSTSTPPTPGQSELCKKNAMLAYLLARQPQEPTTPLPSPNPNLRPFTNGRPRASRPQLTPQQNLPVSTHSSNKSIVVSGVNINTSSNTLTNTSNSHSLQMLARSAPHYHTTSYDYTTSMPHHNTDSTGEPDSLLSEILDQVIELTPYAPPRQPSPAFQDIKKKMAINEIQKSLMQCETAVKSPVSPGVQSTYSPQPQLYSSSGPVVSVGQVTNVQTQQGVATAGRVRTMSLAHQQRARLLNVQSQQQMLVSQGAEHSNSGDLASIDALLNASMPPNVSLTRTDYLYHQSQNQVNANISFASNKMTSQQQQNPMLSAQLTSGYSPTGLPPAYPRRPQHPAQHVAQHTVQQIPQHTMTHVQQHSPLGGNVVGQVNTGASEFVRQELRNVVGARTRLDHDHYDNAPPGTTAGGEAAAARGAGTAVTTTAATTTGAGAASDGDVTVVETGQTDSLLQRLLSE